MKGIKRKGTASFAKVAPVALSNRHSSSARSLRSFHLDSNIVNDSKKANKDSLKQI